MPFTFTLTYRISGADLMFYKNGVERKVATTKEVTPIWTYGPRISTSNNTYSPNQQAGSLL